MICCFGTVCFDCGVVWWCLGVGGVTYSYVALWVGAFGLYLLLTFVGCMLVCVWFEWQFRISCLWCFACMFWLLVVAVTFMRLLGCAFGLLLVGMFVCCSFLVLFGWCGVPVGFID